MTYETALKSFEIVLDWLEIVSSTVPKQLVGVQVDDNAAASITLGCDKYYELLPTDDDVLCSIADYHKKYLWESPRHVLGRHISGMYNVCVAYVGDDMLYFFVYLVGKDWMRGHVCYQYVRSTGKSMYLCVRGKVWKACSEDLNAFIDILCFLYRAIGLYNSGKYFDQYNMYLQCLRELEKGA